MRSKACAEPSPAGNARLSIRAWIRHKLDWLNLCMEIYTERRTLAKLTDQQLQDIGIHRADVDTECRRSVFDLPPQRRATWHGPTDCPPETRAKPF